MWRGIHYYYVVPGRFVAETTTIREELHNPRGLPDDRSIRDNYLAPLEALPFGSSRDLTCTSMCPVFVVKRRREVT